MFKYSKKSIFREYKLKMIMRKVVVMSVIATGTLLSVNTYNVFAHGILGDINHYNGIVFGTLTAQNSESEGPIAVKGNMNAPMSMAGESYTVNGASVIGNHYENKNNFPDLTVGGTLSKSSNVNSNLIVNSIYLNQYGDVNHAIPSYITPKTINQTEIYKTFDEFNSSINDAILKIDTIFDSKSNNDTYSKFVTYNLNNKIMISNFESFNELKTGINNNEIRYPSLNDKDFLIVKSNDEVIRLDNTTIHCNESLRSVGTKVLFYFPNAREINIKGCEFIGSILAPKATINQSGGGIDGQIMVNNYNTQNGAELHNFRFRWEEFKNIDFVPDKEPTPSIPDREPTPVIPEKNTIIIPVTEETKFEEKQYPKVPEVVPGKLYPEILIPNIIEPVIDIPIPEVKIPSEEIKFEEKQYPKGPEKEPEKIYPEILIPTVLEPGKDINIPEEPTNIVPIPEVKIPTEEIKFEEKQYPKGPEKEPEKIYPEILIPTVSKPDSEKQAETSKTVGLDENSDTYEINDENKLVEKISENKVNKKNFVSKNEEKITPKTSDRGILINGVLMILGALGLTYFAKKK